MSSNKELLNANQTKWTTLPAGKGRQQTQELLQLTARELKNAYDQFIPFWEKERGWEYERYTPLFAGRNIIEVGSGLGYDGITFSQTAQSWTFCDIIESNLSLIKQISRLYHRTNVAFQHLDNIATHTFPKMYDGLYAHGVLHHIPFSIAQQEVANLNNYLNPGATIILLMYPYERWEMCNKPDFDKFGTMTDGPGTPWAEWYDDEKVQQLFGSEYTLVKTINWGHQNAEFVNFELIKNQPNRKRR